MTPEKSKTPEKNTSAIESMRFESGTYKGATLSGIPHGAGSYIHKDDMSDTVITYSGNWIHGKREGEGRESSLSIDTPGTNYIGSWKADQKHGIGKEVNLAPNLMYEGYYGEWENGKKHGLGVTKISYTGYIAGEFQNDELYNGYIMKDGKVSKIIVNGKSVWDIFALIPGIEKKFIPFVHEKALGDSKKKYKEAIQKYQFN